MKAFNPHSKGSPLLKVPLLTLFLCTLLSCSQKEAVPGGRKPPPKDLPNIVLIIMDTVRPDHLSCYAHSRDTTPNLKKLLRTSTIYDEAYSVSCWTIPAHASLFTGLYPIAHGTTQEYWRLEEDLTTLAEVLSDSGYTTIGICENPLISKSKQFDQGFSEFHEVWKRVHLRKNKVGSPAFFQFKKSLEEINGEKPFFFFVNFIQPHSPYEPPKPFKDLFVSDPSIPLTSNMPKEFYLGKRTFTASELAHLEELYDGEIRHVDHMLGILMEDLKEKGEWESTLFIATSDHGENFGDHGHVGHVFSLHEPAIRIPLLIHYPPLFPPDTRVSFPVQLTDLFTTLLSILGIEKRFSQGINLLDPEALKNRTVFCEYYRPIQVFLSFGKEWKKEERLKKYDRRLKAVISRQMKLIWSSDGKNEIYDLSKDSGEKTNLMGLPEYAERGEELFSLLERMQDQYYKKRKRNYTQEKMDESTIKALRELGYIQ